jgi:hypothetical protein
MSHRKSENRKDTYKTERNHGVGDASKRIIRQPSLVLAENGCSSARLVDALSGVRACSVQPPVEFCVTALSDDGCFSEQLRVPAEER